MVTATTGSMTFKGRRSGKIINPSIYISDVAAARVTFSQSGAAGTGSEAFLVFPNDGDVYDLIDMVTLLAPTVAVTCQVIINGQPTGLIIQDATTIVSTVGRTFPRFAVRGGAMLTMVQA